MTTTTRTLVWIDEAGGAGPELLGGKLGSLVEMTEAGFAVPAAFGITTAAWTVAPVVSRVIARTGAMLGVIPDAHRDIDESDLFPLLWHAPGPETDKAGAE